MPVFHAVYGLRVASDLPLPGLVISNESGPIDVHVWLKEREKFKSKFSTSLTGVFYTTPESDGDVILRVGVLDNARYFGFFYSDGVRIAIENEGREIWLHWPDDYSLEDVCAYLVGPVIGFVLRLRGITCLHASAVAVDGMAIAIVGVGGAGKSTTAAAFAQGSFPVISDDVAALADHGEQFVVQPGYPRVNLWPDSVRALFGSEESLPFITPTWGKRYLSLNQNGHRFQHTPLPLAAIYLLGPHETNLAVPTVEKVSAGKAFIELVSNTYVNYLLNTNMRNREFELLSRLVANVPVRRVRIPADVGAVSLLRETIVEDARQIVAPVVENRVF